MRIRNSQDQRNRSRLNYGALVAFCAFFASCATVPELKPLTPAEKVQKERALGSQLAQQFDSQVRFKEDKEVSVYLRSIARRLADASPILKESGVGVLMVQDRGGRWRNYGLPGNRIYLSVGMIRAVEFENELAANMAFQFGQILKGHVLLRMQDDRVREQGGDREGTPALLEGIVSSAPKAERDIDYFSPTGIFELSDELNLNAVNPAVEILYQAGYDPRGLVAVWEKLLAHPDRSPYEAVLLRKLIEKTRRTIAQYSPLRNPIVRSQDFISIQRRIQKL